LRQLDYNISIRDRSKYDLAVKQNHVQSNFLLLYEIIVDTNLFLYAIDMLSDDQRHILEEEKRELKNQCRLQSEQIAALKQALIIEYDELRRFQYQEQIQRAEINLTNIKSRLNEVEKQLRSGKPQNELFRLFLWLLLLGSLVGGFWLLLTKKEGVVDLCSNPSLSINCVNKVDKEKPSATNVANDKISNNNKKILDEIRKGSQVEVHTVAVLVPQGYTADFISQDMLEGVADKQAEFNDDKSNNKWKLLVLMVNEIDKGGGQDKGKETSVKLVAQKQVLGVVGPYSSSSLAYMVDTYCKNNLALISPTATIPMTNLKQTIKTYVEIPNPRLDCFYRVTGTNNDAIDKLFKYLYDGQYKRVLIIRDSGNAFTNSFFDNFYDKIRSGKSEIYFEASDDIALSESLEIITKKIKHWGEKYNAKDTAILMIANPKHLSMEDTTKNTQKIIRANRGKFLILGGNSTYHPNLLNELKSTNAPAIDKIVLSVPFFRPKLDNKNKDITWFHDMSSDATQVLIDAISKARDSKTNITREDVQQQIKGLKIKSSTFTGIIEFEGSDRKESPYHLIQPRCSNDSCEWKKINPDDKTRQKSAS
jgi:ABC-type branched-subunit amino acid transport system substrate-binding protein